VDKEKENTDLEKNINLSSLCHADYSAPDFPLPKRVEAHLYVDLKIYCRM